MPRSGNKKPKQGSDFRPIALAVSAGLAIAVFAFIVVRGYYTDVARQQFQRNATYYGATFKNAVERHVTSLAAIHAFVSSSHDVNRWEFSAFAHQTLPQNSGFKAVLWLPLLDQKERKAFEARLQKDGLYGLQLRELTGQGQLVSAGTRDSYLPVAYVEPFEGNGSLIGVDLSNDSIYAPLFRAAEKSGKAAASTPSTQALVEGARLPIVLVAFPLIRAQTDPHITAPAHLEGYALGVLQLDRVIEDAIGTSAPIEAAVAYGGAPKVYVAGNTLQTTPLDRWFGDAAFRQTAPFDVAGQKFLLVMRSPKQADALTRVYAPAGAALLVLAITALLAQSMLATVMRKRTVERAVIARTRELQATNVLLGGEIDQRRQAEAALIEARDKAESANRAKSAFLATMSHELRTPLNAIIGFSGILTGDRPVAADKTKDYAHEINVSGTKLLDLINDILDITQIDTDHADAEDIIDLVELIDAVLSKAEPLAQAGNITLQRELPDRLPQLRGDRRRVQKALFNLVANAIKFGKAGGFARLAAHADPNGLVLEVMDNGVGLPPGAEAKITGLFSQFDSALARRHEGIGLGLTFAHRVAEQHGAELKIASELGKGTRIGILFPAARVVERDKSMLEVA